MGPYYWCFCPSKRSANSARCIRRANCHKWCLTLWHQLSGWRRFYNCQRGDLRKKHWQRSRVLLRTQLVGLRCCLFQKQLRWWRCFDLDYKSSRTRNWENSCSNWGSGQLKCMERPCSPSYSPAGWVNNMFWLLCHRRKEKGRDPWVFRDLSHQSTSSLSCCMGNCTRHLRQSRSSTGHTTCSIPPQIWVLSFLCFFF